MSVIDQWSSLQAQGIEACEKRRYARAEVFFADALKLMQNEVKQTDQLQEKLAQSLNNLAAIYQIQGKYTMALDLYLQSAEINKKSQGEESLAYATSLHNLAIIYSIKREYDKAENLFKEALAIKEKLLGANHTELQSIEQNLAKLLESKKS